VVVVSLVDCSEVWLLYHWLIVLKYGCYTDESLLYYWLIVL